MGKLEQRVVAAAEAGLAEDKYIAPVGLLSRLGWLPAPRIDDWRRGRIPYLDTAIAVDLPKITAALDCLREWAERMGLQPSETSYVAGTRDRRPLRFTSNGGEPLETAFRTHWVSPDLSEKRREQLQARQNKAPDLLVVIPAKAWTCTGCPATGEAGEFLFLEDGNALCLGCADLDQLAFLPSGNAALSRRAKKESRLSAVVVEFSKRRKRYERQGILVEEDALHRAEQQCLADEDVRARRRERDEVRRAAQDIEFQTAFTDRILALYPGCPADRAKAIAEHAATRGSGRVGRTAAGRALDERAVSLAVIASVRHLDTDYDDLLMSGVPRAEARERIAGAIDEVLASWRDHGHDDG